MKSRENAFYARPVGDGLLGIWSVDRLRFLAAELPVEDVALDSITDLDRCVWFPSPRVQPTCREIASHAAGILAADLSDPIVLAADGRVMDGMHRVARAWLEGRATIPALRFAQDPEPDEIVLRPELPVRRHRPGETRPWWRSRSRPATRPSPSHRSSPTAR